MISSYFVREFFKRSCSPLSASFLGRVTRLFMWKDPQQASKNAEYYLESSL